MHNTKLCPGQPYSSGGVGAFAVAVGDFNGDGKMDLAITNRYSFMNNMNNLGILLGKGEGTFDAAVTYATGGDNSFGEAVGDFNGDGKADVAVGNTNNRDIENIGILLGNGDGTFPGAVRNGSGGYQPRSVAVGDFNGDGKPDLAVANLISNNVTVLLNNVNGTFAEAVSYSSGEGPISVAVGDFNGDGKPDLAVANNQSDNVSVLLNNSNGTFAAPVISFCLIPQAIS